MAKAKSIRQLSFTMGDRPGLLSEITTAVAGAKVSITALCAYGMDGKAYFMMITDNNAKAKKALSGQGIEFTKEQGNEDVFGVEMANKAGELQKVAKKIADAGVNIYYMYGTTSSGKTSTCIFSTSDNKKALKTINK